MLKKVSKSSPTKIIEKTQLIADLEEAWSKDRKGKLFVTSAQRRSDRVFIRPHLGKFDIHSHTANSPWPSSVDIIRFLANPSNVMVIASVDKKANVTGYSFLRKTKKISLDKFDSNKLSLWAEFEHYPSLKKHLNSLGVQFRLIPTKGYFFDENLGEFREISSSKK